MNIQILINFFKKYRAVILYFTLLIWFFLLSSESLFASTQPTWLSDEDKNTIIRFVTLFTTGAAALMGMITSFITMFLYPGWTNGTLFWLQDYLKEIWILVSNIVYFIFAFILIAIAFMNIIGRWEWNWELKQAMPKFIVWVLIVPFSWFLVQFLLSISAILTVWVLTLPYDSFSDHELFAQALDNTEIAGEEICKDHIIALNWDFRDYPTEWFNSWDSDFDDNMRCLEGWKVTIKELLTGIDENWDRSEDAAWLQNSVFGIISIYSYGILRIQDLQTLTARDLLSVETIFDLIFKVLFDLLFVVVYLLLMIALLLALFVRGVRLWLYMMLSPVFWLFYFFWKDEAWSDSAKFWVKEFIHLALIPVYVAAALAFGLVFILVATEWVKETNDWENTLNAWGFSITILWAHGSGETEKSVIWKLIVEIFGIAILWIAVMFALSRSDTTGNIIKPIADFWQSVWKLAAASPTYIPIIPAWKDENGNSQRMWVAGLWQFGQTLQSWIQNSQTNRWSEFAQWFLPWWTQWQANLTNRSQQALNTIAANTSWQLNVDNWDQFRAAMAEWSSAEELSRNQTFVRLLRDMLRRAWREDDADNVQPNAVSIARALWSLDEYGREVNQDVLWWRTGDGLLTANNATVSRVDAFLSNRGTQAQGAGATNPQPQAWTPAQNNVRIQITSETGSITSTPEFNRSELEFDGTWNDMSVDINDSIRTALESIITDEVSNADAINALRDEFDSDQARAILRALWRDDT